ncbi:MAG: hypothetical protein JWP97_6775 [Labilithrix sp.]|nr:hypothetical protein [Labilithrix sp.]
MVEKKGTRRSEPVGARTPKLETHDSVPATVRLPPPSERWEKEDLQRTAKMGGGAAAPNKPATLPPPSVVEGVELVIIDELQVPGSERHPWRAAEIWTKRRMYGLDSTFRCIEVVDRRTGKPEPGHELLGARLGGGRLRERDTVRYSYPLPLPGMEAMFTKGKKHGYTSPVEKTIMRVRVLHTSADESPAWDHLGARWSEPPSR